MKTIENQLTEEGKKELEKMAHEGAKKASESLSKLIDKKVGVHTLAVRALPIEKITEIVAPPREIVTTVILEIQGEVDGNVMLVYPMRSAVNVADLLAKRELGATAQLSELDKSAIKESGNIIAGSFLSAISNYLSINMVESIPDIATDMIKATLDFVLARFAENEPSEAVAFEIDFEMGTKAEKTKIKHRIKAHLIVLLSEESAEKVLEALKRISGGEKIEKQTGT
jgi:chemotaxis protein CheC